MYTAEMFSKVNAVFRGEPKAGQSFLAAKAKKKKKKRKTQIITQSTATMR